MKSIRSFAALSTLSLLSPPVADRPDGPRRRKRQPRRPRTIPAPRPRTATTKAALALQAKDNAKAMKFLPGARDHDTKACVIAAEILANGQGVPADRPKSADFYKRGCDGGILVACANEASMRYTGEGGVTVDKTCARALFERPAAPKCSDNCNNAATMMASGDGGPGIRPKRAACPYDMACGGAYLQACVAAARYLAGQGGGEDKAKAKSYFEKACDGKTPMAASTWRVLYGSRQRRQQRHRQSPAVLQKAARSWATRSRADADQLKPTSKSRKPQRPKPKPRSNPRRPPPRPRCRRSPSRPRDVCSRLRDAAFTTS